MRSKLRRLAYVLGAMALFLLITYVCFTWGSLQV